MSNRLFQFICIMTSCGMSEDPSRPSQLNSDTLHTAKSCIKAARSCAIFQICSEASNQAKVCSNTAFNLCQYGLYFLTIDKTGPVIFGRASACKGAYGVVRLTNFIRPGNLLYTREAAAIVLEIFRSITLQENTWTTRNKESTQIFT